jgi:hypothetical protein
MILLMALNGWQILQCETRISYFSPAMIVLHCLPSFAFKYVPETLLQHHSFQVRRTDL